MNKLRKKSVNNQGTLTAFHECTTTCPCTCYCAGGYPTVTDYTPSHDNVGFRLAKAKHYS